MNADTDRPEARLVHQSPGRLRFKIAAWFNQGERFAALQSRIEAWPGVFRVQSNPLTTSVLVCFDGDPQPLINRLKRASQISWQSAEATVPAAPAQNTPSSNPPPLWEKVERAYAETNARVRNATGEQLDLPALLFLGLVGYGVRQLILRPRLAISWDSAFWFALNLYLLTRIEKEVDDRDKS